MDKRHRLGTRGENHALHYLKGLKYELVAKNFRFRRGEIDLVVKKGDTLVFVEVKTRSSLAFGFPEDTLSFHQKSNILTAAEAFMEQLNWNGPVRFDIIAIHRKRSKLILKHLEDAFY